VTGPVVGAARYLCAPNAKREDTMRLPRSYLMLAHAAFFAILTIACANDNAVQPAGPLTVSTLEVTVTTSGSDPDTDGYFLGGTRPGDAEGMSIDAVVPVNGTATLSGIPADTYKMVLEGVAPNCDPVTQLPPQLVIENARVARLSIHIQCTDSLQLTYRVGPSSSGGDSLSVTGQVWMVDLTGKNVSRVTTDSRSHETPAWSPDGSRLAFVSDREGGATIWIMEPTGDVSPVNTGLQQNFGPQWSPDGQRLVFFSPVDGITQLFTSTPTALICEP
jgi:Periplasmic component of the Tol biopolymer transport system